MGNIIVIEGKKVNLDTCETIYYDGSFSSRGVALYKTSKGNLVWCRWTKWQGEHDKWSFVTPEEAKELLIEQEHPGRVARALQAIGVELEEA